MTDEVNMNNVVRNITQVVEDFNSTNDHHPEGLLIMGNTLTSNMFFLEKYRNNAHTAYEATIYSLRNQGEKVNAATNTANVKHPELYMLRRLIEASERVHIQISVQLKWLHAELLSGGTING
jgi:hypothetical protein